MVTATGTAAPVRLGRLGGALLLLAVLLVGVPAPIQAATDPNLCYIVADVGGGNGGNDLLIAFDRSDDSFTAVGTGTGTNDIEAADMWPGTDTLYAVDADELGTIDLTTGVYTTLGGPFGLANGPDGPQTLSDADGIAFDPFTFVIWAAERNPGSPDYLFKIDPTTGAFVPDAFGPGLDYIVSTPTTDLPRSRDLDDIAVSTTTGEVFGLANRGASIISQRLVTIDPLTGDQTLVGQFGVEDVEGLSFNPFGQLYATDGSDDLFFDVDPATGAITQTREIGLAGDYESVSCLTGDTNLVEGTVFRDTNADGVQGPPEQGRADVTVELVRDLDGDGVAGPDEPVVAVRLTDGNGDYGFEIAAVGDFVVRADVATLPAGAETTSPPALPVAFDGVGLVVSEVDFGFIRPATVGDRVWLDLDGDGIQDEGEPGLAGVTVQLQDGNGNVIDTTTTDGDGAYALDAAAGVDYAVVVTPPDGGAFTLQDVGGDDTVDSDVDPAGVTATITPDLGANPQVGDAGVLPASIGDLVFLDDDGDGIQDDGDVGLAGIVVDLLDGDGAVIATTTTGDDGSYSFVGLVPGATYRVNVTAPDGATFSPQDVGGDDGIDSDVDAGGTTGAIVPASGANPGVGDAGIVAALLRGAVFIDDDADGTADPGEQPAPGVTVTLHDLTGAIVGTTVTDADGTYEFTGLLPGAEYRVAFTADGDFSPVGATSDVDVDGNVVVAVVSGINVGDADAGIIPPPSPPSPSPSPSPTPSTTPVEPPTSSPPTEPVPPPPTPPLPATGAPLLAMALLAAGLVLTGLALAAPRRRRVD